jgi:hypothetical protein
VRRLLPCWVAISVVLCGIVAGAGPAAAQKEAVKADEQAVLAANRAFEQAVATGVAASLSPVLDNGFTWVDSSGTLQTAEEVLGNISAGNPLKPVAVSGAAGAQVLERTYGQLALVQVHVGRAYALHLFAKRSQGWRPLHVIELVQPAQAAQPAAGSAAAAAVPSEAGLDTPCINPCKVVPFKPATPGAKAAWAAWLEMEQGSLTRNMDLWGSHVLDEIIIVDSGGNGVINKTQRIGNTLKQKAAGVRTNEVPPVLWARTYDFGDAVLLLMLQQPYKGQPYYATRIYVNRDGRYQMAVSYHTSIASVPEFVLSKQVSAK